MKTPFNSSDKSEKSHEIELRKYCSLPSQLRQIWRTETKKKEKETELERVLELIDGETAPGTSNLLQASYPATKSTTTFSDYFSELFEKKYNVLNKAAPEPEDVYFNGYSYGIKVPTKTRLEEISREFRDSYLRGQKLEGIDLACAYNSFVHSLVPHAFEKGVLEDKKVSKEMKSRWRSLYVLGKVFDLDRAIDASMPAVCFEKSILLGSLLSSDEEFKKSGFGCYVTSGFHKGASPEEKLEPHSWLTITYKDRLGKTGKVMLLDPTSGRAIKFPNVKENGMIDMRTDKFSYIENPLRRNAIVRIE